MDVLIVESNEDLGHLWQRHLARQGCDVMRASNSERAIELLSRRSFTVVILDLGLEDGSPLSVADFATYRWPDSRIIVVTSRSFFSDGSVFGLSPNVCAYVPTQTPPEDLTAIIEHYGQKVDD